MTKLNFALIGFLSIISGSVNAQNISPGPNIGDRGEVTFTYRNATVTYKTVRAEDGNIWTLQNLGADKIADSINDANARGHLFQWGRWDDGHQVIDPESSTALSPTPNDPSSIPGGSDKFFLASVSAGQYINRWWEGGNNNDTWSNNPPSATNGFDPCSALGKGWHIPSKSEWENLIDEIGALNSADMFNSAIKLSGCGSRAGSTGLVTANVSNNNVQYWTSTPSNASAWYVYPTQNSGGNFYRDVATQGRSYGRACRCMKLKVDCTTITDSSAINICSQDLESGYMLPGGETVQRAGVYADSFKTEDDCDSIIVTILTEEKINTDVENTGHSLMAHETGAIYQWLDCDLDYAEVENADQQALTPSVAGNFAVAITKNGCTDTSSCYPVEPVKIDGINIKSDIKIYPNPIGSSIHIISPVPVNASLISVDGKMILNDESAGIIHVGNLSPGLYFLKLKSTDGILLKTEKIIKSK